MLFSILFEIIYAFGQYMYNTINNGLSLDLNMIYTNNTIF